jgi:hypothetical protein
MLVCFRDEYTPSVWWYDGKDRYITLQGETVGQKVTYNSYDGMYPSQYELNKINTKTREIK